MPTAKKTSAKKAPAKKAAPKKPASKGDVPTPFDDLNTAEDSQAVPGHFVEVTQGPHKDRYGVLVEQADENNVVVKTRDSANERIVVKYTELAPAESGRR